MGEQGIKILREIDNETSALNRVAIVKTVQYQSIDNKWKEELWRKYGNVFGGGRYSDSTWTTTSEFGDSHTSLRWDDIDKWQDALRVFVLLIVDRGVQPYYAVKRVHDLINFLEYTDWFSDDCFPDFDDDPNRYCYSGMMRSDITAFCDFVGLRPQRYIDRINELRFDIGVRDIPAFPSIYKFDKIISEYKDSVAPDDPFIVIVLWWELTKVIPIRPIEFFTLRRDSFFIEDGRPYVKVKRAKVRDKQHEVPVLDKIGISKDIYDLFDRYRTQNAANLPEGSSFLFSVSIFNSKYDLALLVEREGYIGSRLMYILFHAFLDEVVTKQFGYTVIDKGGDLNLADNEIEYFQYGDSRHIAFLNLLLTDYSPYTIAQIGGHTTIHQQMHYYDHMNMYLESKAFVMAKEARLPVKTIAKEFDIREKYALSKAVSFDDNELRAMRRIDIGWCNSDNFPYECEFDDCINCPHSIIDDEHQKMIASKMEYYKTDIRNHVDFLKRILSNPALGSDTDRMTAINALNCDTAALAALQNKLRTEV